MGITKTCFARARKAAKTFTEDEGPYKASAAMRSLKGIYRTDDAEAPAQAAAITFPNIMDAETAKIAESFQNLSKGGFPNSLAVVQTDSSMVNRLQDTGIKVGITGTFFGLAASAFSDTAAKIIFAACGGFATATIMIGMAYKGFSKLFPKAQTRHEDFLKSQGYPVSMGWG